jgi:hypothetical protein
MLSPPLLKGAENDIETVGAEPPPPPFVTLTDWGADAVVKGFADTIFDVAPGPSKFIARITTLYVTPFVNPEIVIGEEADAGLLVVHNAPLFIENW